MTFQIVGGGGQWCNLEPMAYNRGSVDMFPKEIFFFFLTI